MSGAFEYRIVVGQQDDVEKVVADLSKDGWQLHGGLLMSTPNPGWHEFTFAQAMIKEYEAPAEGGFY